MRGGDLSVYGASQFECGTVVVIGRWTGSSRQKGGKQWENGDTNFNNNGQSLRKEKAMNPKVYYLLFFFVFLAVGFILTNLTTRSTVASVEEYLRKSQSISS